MIHLFPCFNRLQRKNASTFNGGLLTIIHNADLKKTREQTYDNTFYSRQKQWTA